MKKSGRITVVSCQDKQPDFFLGPPPPFGSAPSRTRSAASAGEAAAEAQADSR